MSKIILNQFVLGPIEDNNYLLVDEESKEAVLIDCTEDSQEIDNALKKHDAKLKYILLTHGHFDHVLGVNDFKRKYPDCKVFIHQADQVLLDTMGDFLKSFMFGHAEIQKVDGYIEENQIIKFGQNEIKVIHTPGHTLGGVCYLIGDEIFTGDTLFKEAVGRTDLPGGNFSQLKTQIESKLYSLDENIRVYPGHGPSSTIGHEKRNNKFL